MLSELIQQIKDYQGKLAPNCLRCRHCNNQPGFFKRHSARPRKFLVTMGRVVFTVASVVLRWRCALCGKTATDYPHFALPHKRYTRQSVAERFRRYLDNDNLTYRQSVQDDDMPVCYDTEIDPSADGRCLAHSSVWRWMSTPGGLKKTMRKAIDLIKQSKPASPVFHSPANLHVAKNKYRSKARLAVLKICRQLFLVEDQFNALYSHSIFPDLAASCGWT